MKQIFVISILTLCALSLHAQTLFEPLRQFAEACVMEKQALDVQNPDYNKQFDQLLTSMKLFAGVQIEDGSRVLHPSYVCQDANLDNHIIFAPTYIADYLNGKIPDPYAKMFPYVQDVPIRVISPEKTVRGEQDSTVYAVNKVLCPNSYEAFSYRVSAGEQQLIVVAENDTPLKIEVVTSAGTTVIRPDQQTGFAQHIWNETGNHRSIFVRILNPTDKQVSFVFAAH